MAVIGLGAWAVISLAPHKAPPPGPAPVAAAPAKEAFPPVTPAPQLVAKSQPKPAAATPARPVLAAPAPTLAAAPAAAIAPGVVATLLDDAKKLKDDDHYPEAREKAQLALAQAGNEAGRNAARDALGEIDIGLVFSERPMAEKVEYVVQSGDTLGKLASRFGTTVDLISKGNKITGQNIRVGDHLRIFAGKFTIKVDKSDNVLDVYVNDLFFKRYRVGTGQYSKTPTGTFKITDRIAQPTWYRDDGKIIPYGDPENLLGTHWLALDARGYGIHGTWQPDTIGKQSSAGCIRLLNDDIAQLFTLLPVGTQVVIED